MKKEVSAYWTSDHHDGEVYRRKCVDRSRVQGVYQRLLSFPMLCLSCGFSVDTFFFSVYAPCSELYFSSNCGLITLYSAQKIFTDFTIEPKLLFVEDIALISPTLKEPFSKVQQLWSPRLPKETQGRQGNSILLAASSQTGKPKTTAEELCSVGIAYESVS